MGLFKKKEKAESIDKKEMKTYITHAGGCIITKSLLENKTTLKWVFRETSLNDVDNGWRAFGEGDDDEYVNDANNLCIVDFNTLANMEPSVLHIYDMPVGSELEFKRDQSGSYFIDCISGKEIREKVKSPLQEAFEANLQFISKQEHALEELQCLFDEQKQVQWFTLGEVSMPSGQVVVADPLCYLQSEKHFDTYVQTIAPNKYPVTLSIIQGIAGVRIAGAKLTITAQEVVRYEIAQCCDHQLAGFGVDAGMCCFADVECVHAYHTFLKAWYQQNPNGNIYDDYFKALFAQSYKEHPTLQREEGDFLLWQIPNTSYNIAMFASGLGDGFYSSFWGYDQEGKIAQLVIPFMRVDLFVASK